MVRLRALRKLPGRRIATIAAILAFALLGSFAIYRSLAATSNASHEAEHGKLTTGTFPHSSTGASNTQSVTFGSLQQTTSATTTQVAQLTGAAGINQTDRVNVCGTDLGVMFNWLDRTFFAFGDTQRCQQGFPSNTLAFSGNSGFKDGVKFDGWAMDGNEAKEIIPKDNGVISSIPTGAVGIGENAYIFYMNVTQWDPDWLCSGSSLATANASDIGDWTKHPEVSWGAGNFNMVAVMEEGDTVYIYGTPCGRFGSVKLMKVTAGSLLNKSAYQYYTGLGANGAPTWSGNEASAVTVAGGPAGELSVMYNRWLGRYMMTYLDENKAAIVMREAETPWGPWSEPTTLTTGATHPSLYGAYLNPLYVENDGQTFYYTMSIFDSYQVFQMKTSLQKR